VVPPPRAASPAAAAAQAGRSPSPPAAGAAVAADPVEGGIVWVVQPPAGGNSGDEHVPLPPGSPLFNLDIDLPPQQPAASGGGGGSDGPRKGRLVVVQGAAITALALQFMGAHGLPAGVLPKLSALVERSVRTHQAALLLPPPGRPRQQ
jgi:hypothetical protein